MPVKEESYNRVNHGENNNSIKTIRPAKSILEEDIFVRTQIMSRIIG